MGFSTPPTPGTVPPADSTSPPAHLLTGPDHRRGIARLLGLPSEHEPGVDEFLQQSRQDGTDLSVLWAAPACDGAPEQVALAVRSPGRTAVVFASPFDEHEPPTTRHRRAAAIAAATTDAKSKLGARLAQTLLEPHERGMIDSFRAADFMHLASLAYMRRDLRRFGVASITGPSRTAALPAGVQLCSHASLSPQQALLFLREALEASYVGTLDCPALCGLRSLDDVVDSHTAVGAFDPNLWWYILAEGRAVGCLLLSPIPGNETVELVYLGLAPIARGRGIGNALMAIGLRALAGRRERTLACAVDTANAPALHLYKRWKFNQFTTRTALVRPT